MNICNDHDITKILVGTKNFEQKKLQFMPTNNILRIEKNNHKSTLKYIIEKYKTSLNPKRSIKHFEASIDITSREVAITQNYRI